MSKRSRRTFTAEFKAEAVRLAKVGDRSIGKLALDLGVVDSVLREWIAKAQMDAPGPTREPLADDERKELMELRREVRQLREDREILKNIGGLLREGEPVKLAFIDAQKAQHAVEALCRLLGVAPCPYVWTPVSIRLDMAHRSVFSA